MPLPKPNSGERQSHFINRCMANPTMNSEYPDPKQRRAVCQSQWDRSKKTDDVTHDGGQDMTNFKCGECGVEGIAGDIEHLETCSRHDQSDDVDPTEMFHTDLPVLAKTLPIETENKDIDVDARMVTHKISTALMDRHQDIVEQNWDLNDYTSNPVVLLDHNYGVENIVGQNLDMRLKRVHGGETWARTRFTDVTEKAQAAFRLLADGVAKAWSVGFIGTDVHRISDGAKNKCKRCIQAKKEILNGRDEDSVWIHGRHFIQAKMYEYSLVAIPANPQAVMAAIQKGIVSDKVAHELFRCIEDDEDRMYEEIGKAVAGHVGIAVGEAIKPMLEEIATINKAVAGNVEYLTNRAGRSSVLTPLTPEGPGTASVSYNFEMEPETKTTTGKEASTTPPPQDGDKPKEAADAPKKAKADKSNLPWSLSGKNTARRVDVALKVKEALGKDVRGRFLKHNTPRRRG
jgi:hypothetical protein